MAQIAIFGFILLGLFMLAKGTIKVSDTKVLKRPASVYLGSILVISNGIALFFLSSIVELGGMYLIGFFGALLVIAIIFVMKADKVETEETQKKSSQTKRNLLILFGFITLIVVASYLWLNFG